MARRKTLKEVKTAEVIPFNGNVILLLEFYLEKAREGEIAEVAIATVHPHGTAEAVWAGCPGLRLLGAVSILQNRLCRGFEE